jgi:hypothetical protein
LFNAKVPFKKFGIEFFRLAVMHCLHARSEWSLKMISSQLRCRESRRMQSGNVLIDPRGMRNGFMEV